MQTRVAPKFLLVVTKKMQETPRGVDDDKKDGKMEDKKFQLGTCRSKDPPPQHRPLEPEPEVSSGEPGRVVPAPGFPLMPAPGSAEAHALKQFLDWMATQNAGGSIPPLPPGPLPWSLQG